MIVASCLKATVSQFLIQVKRWGEWSAYETKEHVLQDFRFTFVEVPKFLKTEAELHTVEDKWLYFLKHAKRLKAIPAVIHEAALKEAFEIVNRLNWDEASLELYDIRGIYIQDEIQRVNYSYRKGQRTLLQVLLEQRFGPLPAHYQERLDKADDHQLLLWCECILNAKTLVDIFKI